METEIINFLQEIKFLLMLILGIVSILFLYLATKEISRIFITRTINRDNVINFMASELYDKEDFLELEKYCNEKLGKHPNNPYVVYWLARAHLKLNNFNSALEMFKKVKELEEGWDDSVDPYIEKINNTSLP